MQDPLYFPFRYFPFRFQFPCWLHTTLGVRTAEEDRGVTGQFKKSLGYVGDEKPPNHVGMISQAMKQGSSHEPTSKMKCDEAIKRLAESLARRCYSDIVECNKGFENCSKPLG